MKKVPLLLIVVSMLAIYSCTKDAAGVEQDVTTVSAKPDLTLDLPSPNPRTTEPLTDEQLFSMGQSLGCELAKRSNSTISFCVDSTINGVVQYDPQTGVRLKVCLESSAFDRYQNTIDNTLLPAIYRDGVRSGWISCYTQGVASTNTLDCAQRNVIQINPISPTVTRSVAATICEANPKDPYAPGPIK